jgi:TPR repeat protein
LQTLTALRRASSDAELIELCNERKILVRCPFCREDEAEAKKERYQRAMIHAENGKAWAQAYVGHVLYSGQEGVAKDIQAALHWLTLAAGQGDTDAITLLSVKLFKEPEAMNNGGNGLGPRLG